jgi:GxxExxY protein
MTENAIAREIVDSAFRIHTTLGPGLLESVYQTVLAYELGRRNLRVVSQQVIPLSTMGFASIPDFEPIW